MTGFDTPILYLIFNRPDLVKVTFPQIRELKPKFLFIGADGPRKDHPEDEVNCEECRQWVLNAIDWECEVKTLFRDENLGCGLAVSGAITWFFEHVEMGIILEDDCLANNNFFEFCSVLLRLYRNEPSVMHISGNNFQPNPDMLSDYYFSKYSHIWGWATWRDRWYHYQWILPQQLGLRENPGLSKKERLFWEKYFKNVSSSDEASAWDVKWQYALMRLRGVSILPSMNLVTNIGSIGTHYSGGDADTLFIPTYDLLIPASLGKKEIVLSEDKDSYTFHRFYQVKMSFVKKVKFEIKRAVYSLKKLVTL